MKTEAKFKWRWLGMAVVLLGMTLRVTLSLVFGDFGLHFVMTPIATAWQVLGGSGSVGYQVGESVAYTLPTLILCVWGFAYLVDRASKESDESCCRRCGYILRGLSAPRCPECGETI